MITNCRLVGRSVWNTKWLLIIPGGTLLSDPNQGLDTLIDGMRRSFASSSSTYAYRETEGR